MYDFLTLIKPLDPASENDAQALAEHVSMRVQDALCGVAEAPGDAQEIQQALIDDLTLAPAACLLVALTELHSVAAYLFGRSDRAWTAFRRPGVDGRLMADELAALGHNPYRYVTGGLCDHAASMSEHLVTVFELVQVMVRAWPDDGCPICCYFDCEAFDFDDDLPDESLLQQSTATTPA